MDAESIQVLKKFFEKCLPFCGRLKSIFDDCGRIYTVRLVKLMHLLVPIVTVVLVYYYFRNALLFSAHRYELYMKKRYGHMKKVSKQLKHLLKRYKNFYFCYMPINHGTILPRPYTLFLAIKEIFINSNRPATRALRTNLLDNLVRGDQMDNLVYIWNMTRPEAEYFTASYNDLDPLSDFNLDIMKYCRELIIQGVKDFDVMSTVYRVMETVVEDGV